MLGTLIEIAGLWFVVAVGLEALAVFAEQWGAARSPEEDSPKHGALALVALLLTVATPGLLLAHGYISTRGQEQTVFLLAIAAPIAAVLVGALLGAIMGAVARGAAPLMRKLAVPLDVIAFGATLYATLATIQVLIQAAQQGGVLYVTP